MASKNNKSEFENLRIGDTIYRTKVPDSFKTRVKYEVPNPRKLLAFIPGTIAEIRIKKGQKVKEGEILMLLEAMKMKNHVKAPFDGIVKSISVKVGQVVSKNFMMAELE